MFPPSLLLPWGWGRGRARQLRKPLWSWQGNRRVKRAPVTEPGWVGGGNGLPAMRPSTHALSGCRGVGWGAINSRPLTGVGNRNPIQTVW